MSVLVVGPQRTAGTLVGWYRRVEIRAGPGTSVPGTEHPSDLRATSWRPTDPADRGANAAGWPFLQFFWVLAPAHPAANPARTGRRIRRVQAEQRRSPLCRARGEIVPLYHDRAKGRPPRPTAAL